MSDLNDLDQLLRKFELGTLESDQGKLGALGDRPLYLYGAGNMGKRLYRQLSANGISIAGFIDRNPAAKHNGIAIPSFTPDSPELEAAKISATIILSGLFPLKVCQEIKATLTALGFQHIHALHEVNFTHVSAGIIRQTLFDDDYNKLDVLGADRLKIEQAFGLLAGEDDQKLFLQLLKAHLTMDFTRLDEPHNIGLQYLAHDIQTHKDYTRFVDCGGYDGDTFRQLADQVDQIDTLAAFEPQVAMYQKYAKCIHNHPKAPLQTFLFPCGVHSETTQLRFATNDDAQSAARLSTEGDQIIQCVAIDEALQGFRPTFIKMDIEGAEIDALHGARNTIESVGPGLAICVYHRFSDLWEIPCLIHSMRTDYRYYLRNYNYLGLETVLYALRSPD
jgi:FkbM family methyltransferase